LRIVVDESVSYDVVTHLRSKGYHVIAIAETGVSGLKDPDVFKIVKNENALLISRDNHFTNSLRFPPDETACIVFIRKGNLTSNEEKDLIEWFFNSHSILDFKGRLVSISKDHVKVR
jgi:predicted nuclease of predicted toxin-antitoxin system